MPKNKYLENVDKLIDFTIFNKIFDHLYSDIGQKAFSPSMQVKIIFLQTNYSLSDRQLEERLNFDLSWKMFVGFPAGYTADKFKYDPLLSIVICPAGRLTSMNHRNESAGATVYQFSAAFCSNCSKKTFCTKSNKGRTITIEDTWAVAEDARRYLRTPEGRQDMIIRSQLERVNNELKNNLGLKVSRYYGLAKHQIQLHATAFVYNIRQTIRLVMRGNAKKVAVTNAGA